MTDELILASCLEAVENGESVESCLAAYPEDMHWLAPLLQIAADLKGMPQLEMSPAAFAHGCELVRQVARNRQAQASPDVLSPPGVYVNGRAHALHLHPLAPAELVEQAPRRICWPKIAMVACAACFVLISSLTLRSAARSLPGDTLYPIKRAGEELQGAVMITIGDRVLWQTLQARRRVQEWMALETADRPLDPALVANARIEAEAALLEAASSPSTEHDQELFAWSQTLQPDQANRSEDHAVPVTPGAESLSTVQAPLTAQSASAMLPSITPELVAKLGQTKLPENAVTPEDAVANAPLRVLTPTPASITQAAPARLTSPEPQRSLTPTAVQRFTPRSTGTTVGQDPYPTVRPQPAGDSANPARVARSEAQEKPVTATSSSFDQAASNAPQAVTPAAAFAASSVPRTFTPTARATLAAPSRRVSLPTVTKTPAPTLSPTATPSATPALVLLPTVTNTPISTPTPTRGVTSMPTSTAMPTSTPTIAPPISLPTNTVLPTNTPAEPAPVFSLPPDTPLPTNTPAVTATAFSLPIDTPQPTNTPAATATAFLLPTDSPQPTNTPAATATVFLLPTDTPQPTNTPAVTATVFSLPTDTPQPTNTPAATATVFSLPTDTPLLTNTPAATATAFSLPTDTPLPTNTPAATATPVLQPTDTPVQPATTSSLPTDIPPQADTPASQATPVIQPTAPQEEEAVEPGTATVEPTPE